MEGFRINHIMICPVIGIGYWKDVYNEGTGFKGYAHNIILPFCRMQFGYLYKI